ncbi:MAG: hypothetical protein ABJZ55_15570 [Fuerstiella sp.]
MSPTVVERELFPNCSVSATLDRIGQGMEWRMFLDRALNNSQITWAIETSHSSAIIGHTSDFTSLEKHISTFAAKSYSISGPVSVDRLPFKTPGEASGRVKKQSSSADQYAFITIQAEPRAGSNTVQLSIPHSDKVAVELHDPEMPDAILDGVCLAALANNFAKPLVGFHVTVVEAKWHPVDSYSGVFKRATCMAMFDILRHDAVAG